jgi:serine/threonine protein kinase
VWIADHLALRTQVVVKFMSVELAANAEAVERFSREAAAAAQAKSPHVVQMLDHGITPDGLPFIVMEKLEGHDLAKDLEVYRRLSLPRTAEIIGQVCKALARAHERGIVHRDIKPDNIFLCEVGGGETFVKVLDFGIAKGGDMPLGGSSGTRTGAMIGTPYYMSPEQMVGAKGIDHRTDLWSLGVVAYQCVVGAKPFDAETFGALTLLIHSSPLPVPSATNPSLPPAFDAWFTRACARDPASRFASAKELSDALSGAANAEAGPWSGPGGQPSPRAQATIPLYANVGSTAPLVAAPLATSLGGRSSTNGGIGLGTGTYRAPGARTATWIVGMAVVLATLASGGVWLVARGRSAIPPPSATALVVAPPPTTAPLPPPPAATPAEEPTPTASAADTALPRPPVPAHPMPNAAWHPPAKVVPAKPATTPTTRNNEKDIF